MPDEDRDISNADFWKKAGDDYIKEEQYEKAIECFKEAIDLDPTYTAAWNNLGFSYFKLGRLDEAKKVKKKLDELKDRSPGKQETPKIPIRTSPPQNTGEPIQKPSYLKSPGLAAFISFFFPGAGHIYDGQSKKGFLLLIGTFIGAILLLIPGIIVWFYGIYDSYKTAHRINFGEIPYNPTNILHLVVYFVLYIIGIIVVLAVIAAFVFGMAGTTETTSGSPSSIAGTSIGTKNLPIGETAILRSEGQVLAVTLLSVDDITSDGILKVKYQNNGSKAIQMNGGGWTIVDYGGIEYSHYGDQSYNFFTLYPGDSKTLDYTWDIVFWDPFGQSDYNQKLIAIKKGSKIYYTFNDDSSAVASWILFQ